MSGSVPVRGNISGQSGNMSTHSEIAYSQLQPDAICGKIDIHIQILAIEVYGSNSASSSVSAIYFHPRSACGEMFRRIHWNNRGCKSIVWRCISRLEPTGQECHARTVNETVLENVVVQAINTLLGDTSTYQAQLQQNIAKVIRSAQQKTADGIDERLQELQKELLKKANNKEAYDEIADEIFKLREQ